MAKRKPGFQKGNQYGKKTKGGGRPAVDVEIVQLRELNRGVITGLLTKYVNMTVNEMRVCRENPRTPVLDQIIIAICIKAVNHGDSSRANWLVENLVGKLPQKLEVKSQTFHGQMLEKLEDMRKK